MGDAEMSVCPHCGEVIYVPRTERMGMVRQDVTPEQIKKRQAERANGGPCQGHRACLNDVAASIGDG